VAPASYEPVFETAECQFEVPDGSEVRCGYLTVPEDRSTFSAVSRVARLHVAIVKSVSDDPAPDPFVYLAGGPGGYALDNISGIVQIFDAVLRDRDLIVFDQRGAGYSEPSLDCPEITELVIDTLDRNLTAEEEIELSGTALRACRRRVLREGADLSAYNSAQNAADVNDLRLALGYDEWNLYGVSYGTRLALTVLRDFPKGVRSVILDSVFPPQVDSLAERGANAERAFDLLFERCALNDACSAAFPDLEAAFYSLVAQLDAEPIVVQVQSLDVVLNGDDLIGLLFELLYDSDAIPTLPELIFDVASGSYDDLERWVFRSIVQSVFVSEGMYGSVECVEEYPLSAAARTVNDQPALGQARLGEYFTASLESSLAICDVWNVDAAGAFENGVVTSDVPTLVLTGDYDPVTPPAWGRLAAETLDRSFYFEFSGVGHGVYGARECARELVDAFLAAPTVAPDADCVDDVAIDFVTP
jgi:pimeloyl-ACP methyl ester carboxylesterase